MNHLKKQLRKAIAERKSQYRVNTLVKMAETLLKHIETHPAFIKAGCVLIYHSLPDEVYTHAFVEKWKDKKTILLPVVIGNDLELRKYSGKQDMQKGSYGIEEPIGKAFTNYDKIDLAIIPGVGFDSIGNRLGRGKGYYDRLLPKLKAHKIGICFSFQTEKEIPTEEYDIKMDEVLTEEGFVTEK